MIIKREFLFVLFAVEFVHFGFGLIPPVVQICSRNEPNLDQCMINSVNSLRPYLASGDLGDGFIVPGLEPFKYQGFSINPAAGFVVKVNNATIIGASNFTIEKLRFNFDKLTLEMIAMFPDLKMFGNYDMRAKVSILDIAGRGDLKVYMTNTKVKVKIGANKQEEDGEVRIKFTKVNIKFQIGKSKVHLTNLFNGDPTLEAVGNQLINENQDIFIDLILPVMEKQFEKLFKDVANGVVGKSNLDELFPVEPVQKN